MPDEADLQKKLGVKCKQHALLEQALIHSSYINENPDIVSGNNERLEFLGDAVLDLIVADRLYRDFPDLAEGALTKLRASLVRRDTLARVARAVGLGDYLYMGKGEEASGGRDKTPNLAGGLEAVIAAVYLDRGMKTTEDMVVRLLEGEWERVASHGTGTDYKSRLQELAQAKFQMTPAYRLVAESGPDHDKRFTVEVVLDNKKLGRGVGKSKKLAETESARQALEKLEKDFTG